MRKDMKIAMIVLLLVSPMKLEAKPHPKLKAVLKVGEHLLLGAAIQTGVTYAAGGPHSAYALRAGASACLLVAGFKEGSDALAGADTPKASLHTRIHNHNRMRGNDWIQSLSVEMEF